MGGGVAILIGLVFMALHFFEAPDTASIHYEKHSGLIFGLILLTVGVLLLGFTRIVKSQTEGGKTYFRRGWMVFRIFPLLWSQTFDTVEVRQHLPRFGGYLGMTSTIVWAVVLVNSQTSKAVDVTGFQTQDEAVALCNEIQSLPH